MIWIGGQLFTADFQLSEGRQLQPRIRKGGLQRGEFATLSGLREGGRASAAQARRRHRPRVSESVFADVTHHILLMVLQHCRYRAYWKREKTS